jgi:predicted GIY-YIG superfamily endonuclease
MSTGIYVLYYESYDNMYYVGKSINIENRFEDHCKKLRLNSHKNKLLLKIYREVNTLPTMYIIEHTTADDAVMNTREVYWISQFDSLNNGMNETMGGEGVGFGESHPNAKLTNDKYVAILEQLANGCTSISDISTILEVPKGIVSSISNGSTHGWLAVEYPQLYLKMKNRAKLTSGCNDLSSRGLVYPDIVSPNGVRYQVTNIRAFAREHGLHNQDLGKVLRGDRYMTKGWKRFLERSI